MSFTPPCSLVHVLITYRRYAAAAESNLDFQLFLSLDMTSLPCSSPEHAAFIRKLVLNHASHPNQLKYNGGRAFVSTFAGELCNFGLGGGAEEVWKNAFTQHPDMKDKVYFVPSFFIDPATFGKFDGVMDGDFNWNSGWPIKVTTNFAKDVLNEISSKLSEAVLTGLGIGKKPVGQVLGSASTSSTPPSDAEKGLNGLQNALSKFIGSTESDDEHLTGLKALSPNLTKRDGEENRPVYMAAVSPWFYTHYGQKSFNKNVSPLSILSSASIHEIGFVSGFSSPTNTSTSNAGNLSSSLAPKSTSSRSSPGTTSVSLITLGP